MTRSPARGKLIAIAIAVVGIGVALLGIYVLKTQRPVAGELLRTIALPDGYINIRAEQGGSRNFIEYRDSKLTWQALIPPYAGADGTEAISFDEGVIMVRVLRTGNEAIFSFARHETSRLGTISLGPTTPALQAAVKQLGGRVWTYANLGYHLVADGEDAVAIGAFDLHTGKPIWKSPLPLTAAVRPPVANELGLLWSDGVMSYLLRADKGEDITRKGGLMCAHAQVAVLTQNSQAFATWDGTGDNAQGKELSRDEASSLCAQGHLPPAPATL